MAAHLPDLGLRAHIWDKRRMASATPDLYCYLLSFGASPPLHCGTKLYCMVTEAGVRKRLALSAEQWVRLEPATSLSQVRRSTTGLVSHNIGMLYQLNDRLTVDAVRRSSTCVPWS